MKGNRMKDKVYMWYSGATDKTGKALVDALKISGGTEKPTGMEVIIGWGTKTSKDVAPLTGTKVILNHPNQVRRNRNKYSALMAMSAAKIAVADFVSAGGVLDALNNKDGKIKLPLVGRSSFHQGGQDFWLCLTKNHVAMAIQNGADYFQNFIDIKDEYRLHIMDGQLIYAQKKTIRDNMAEAFIEQTIDNVKNAAERKGTKLDDATLKLAAEQLSKKQQGHADMIIRSNTRGYRFVSVKEGSVNKDLLIEAKGALNALELQFGAVDCCIDTEGKAWVIEVNTGPGLDGASFDVYKAKFAELLDKALNPPKKVIVKTGVKQPVQPLDKITLAKGPTQGKKEALIAKAKIMQDMASVASDEEMDVIENVFAKMFGGGK
jgi:glutathione synthase/RimK-type ligase-like ATP-grasp enzyme